MEKSFATQVLDRLATGLVRHPRWFLWPQLLVFAGCVTYTVFNLEFHTDRNALVDADKAYHRNFLDYKANFDSQDDIVTVVESEDFEKNRQFVERLGTRLEKEPDLFTGIFFKGDLKMLGPKALLFLEDPSVIQTMGDRIREARPMIEAFEQVNSLESLVKELNRQFRTSPQERTEETDRLIEGLPILQRVIEQAEASLSRRGKPPSPGAETLFGAGTETEQQKYITFSEGRIYLITARPADPSRDHEAVKRLRELVAIVQSEVPGINVGITGEKVLAIDEMRQSQIDSLKASCVSLVLVMLIFGFCYQESGRPLKATLCLLLGLGYTMGYTTLVVGHLNILTIAFFPMLIGLAIDFGVHLITRYEEELRHGASELEAIRKALIHTGQGIFTGCLTTAGAFYAMAFTDFKGVQEMGIITGGGMLLSLIPMLTVLPILLLRGRQNLLDHHVAHQPCPRATLEQVWLTRPRRSLLIGVLISGAAITQAMRVSFDYNLLNMQTEDLQAVQYEKKLIAEAEKSVIYAIVIAASIDEAARLESAIEQLPSVASVDSMTRFLSTDQTRMLEMIRALKRDVGSIRLAEPNTNPVDLDELSQSLTFLQSYLSLAANSTREGDPSSPLAGQFEALEHAASRLQRSIRRLPPEIAQEQLHAFQVAFFTDIRETFHALANQDAREPLSVADLPKNLRDRFVGRTGQHLLQVYPRENAWERSHQETFVRELRDLTGQFEEPPVVTGTPVQLLEYTTLLKRSYEQAALYALGAIAILVLVHFRSIFAVLLALIPVGLGSLWLLGFMGMAEIPFNPANVMTLPLVVGIGVTNGIHILNRYQEERNPSLLSKSTGKGVLVSGLTTMAGFGSLTLAGHRGIESLGHVMTVGVFTCMVAGLVILPCLLQLRVKPTHQGIRDSEERPS